MPRLVARFEQPAFVRWIRANLPESLQLTVRSDGYGEVYKIQRAGAWKYTGGTIADVYAERYGREGPYIVLRQNPYLSDMEILAQKWEVEFGQMVTIEWWPGENTIPLPRVQGGRAIDE